MDTNRWPGLSKFVDYLERPEGEYGPPADETEDLTLGYSMLRALAEHDETMVEIAPGVWRISKAPGDSAL